VIVSKLGVSAVSFRLFRTLGAFTMKRFMCKICVPTSPSGYVLQLQERGASGADRFGHGEAEGGAEGCIPPNITQVLVHRGQRRRSCPRLHSTIKRAAVLFQGERPGTVGALGLRTTRTCCPDGVGQRLVVAVGNGTSSSQCGTNGRHASMTPPDEGCFSWSIARVCLRGVLALNPAGPPRSEVGCWQG
jgi:hypothetical protein